MPDHHRMIKFDDQDGRSEAFIYLRRLGVMARRPSARGWR